MNIRWNGEGEFEGDFTQGELRKAQEKFGKGPNPHITDLFKLLPEDGEFTNIAGELPLICECLSCDNILEAPLMRGSNQCCADSLKQLLYDWLETNMEALDMDDESDLLAWAVWLQSFVDQSNKPKKETGGIKGIQLRDWTDDSITFNLVLPNPFDVSIPFRTEKGDDDEQEEKKTDRRVD